MEANLKGHLGHAGRPLGDGTPGRCSFGWGPDLPHRAPGGPGPTQLSRKPPLLDTELGHVLRKEMLKPPWARRGSQSPSPAGARAQGRQWWPPSGGGATQAGTRAT